LAPWTITDFEILLNGQNTIVATNPGQFYFQPRVTSPFGVTTSMDFELSWSKDFVPQTNGGMPLHAYVRLPGGTTWTDWTPQSTDLCWSATQNTCTNGSDASIMVNNIPADAEVWITAHLDLACKSKAYSCLQPNDPLKRPATYDFTSKTTVNVAGVPVAESTDDASLVGRGKKVTMVYGTLSAPNGELVQNAWVRIKQGSNFALTKTDTKGFYLFFDDQYCSGDGLVACAGWSSQVKFASGTSSATVTVLGNGATQSPTWTTDGGAAPAPYSGTSAVTFNVAKGSAYAKNFKFN
jgi:hypothetical protein